MWLGQDFDSAYDQTQKQGHQEAVALLQNYSHSGDDPDLKRMGCAVLPASQRRLRWRAQ